MIDIQWKGKIGYGDIVSPICYAHNVSYKLQTKVCLTFRWEHGPLQKVHPSDPETLWGRANYINSICNKAGTDIEVKHAFDDPLDVNHTNYDWDVVGKDPYHNYWMPNQKHKTEHNTILVNSTMGNVWSLKQYGKPWKDPLSDKWNHVIDELSKKYVVRVVDYRTPIEKLIRLLRTSRGFFGYHGTAAWTAKLMHTPSIIFADGGKLTRNAFPYAHIEQSKDTLDSVLQNVEQYFTRSEHMIEKFSGLYQGYIPDQRFQEHLHHDV